MPIVDEPNKPNEIGRSQLSIANNGKNQGTASNCLIPFLKDAPIT